MLSVDGEEEGEEEGEGEEEEGEEEEDVHNAAFSFPHLRRH